ncbi:hypothetical protein D3C77_611310 [compost metagenome]
MPTENRSSNTEQMVSALKFYPLDALSAYPEPVGTLGKLEHHDGAVWVHLNGKRSKLVGLQSLAFLIGNLQTIHAEVFGGQPAAQHLADGFSAGDMADQGAKAFRDGQRALALPERRQWNGLGNAADNLKASGWNACLDEVRRLNEASISPE